MSVGSRVSAGAGWVEVVGAEIVDLDREPGGPVSVKLGGGESDPDAVVAVGVESGGAFLEQQAAGVDGDPGPPGAGSVVGHEPAVEVAGDPVDVRRVAVPVRLDSGRQLGGRAHPYPG